MGLLDAFPIKNIPMSSKNSHLDLSQIDDPHTFEEAVTHLLKLNPAGAVNTLIEVLQSDDPWGIRHRIATHALGELGDVSAIPIVTQTAATHHWHRVRETAAIALGHFPTDEAGSALITLLNDTDYAVQCAAALSLGRTGHPDATPALCNQLSIPDRWGMLQMAILESLKALHNPAAVPALIAQLRREDNSSVVTDSILDVFCAIGDEVVGVMLLTLPFVPSNTQTAIAQSLVKLGELHLGNTLPAALRGDADALKELIKLARYGDIRCTSILVDQARRNLASESPSKMALGQLLMQTVAELLPSQILSERLFCRQDLTRFIEHTFSTTPYIACRKCANSVYATRIKHVVALVDQEAPALNFDGEIAYINPLKQSGLFDFDSVKINRATDEEVVRFCIQVGNDPDVYRSQRKAFCTIEHDNQFSANTLGVVRKTFEVAF